MLNCEKVNLKTGSTGEEVIILQKILKNKGFYGGKVDGDFGGYTADAVKKFQRSESITVDGWVGSQTCQKLNKYSQNNSEIATYQQLAGKKFLLGDIRKGAEIFRTHIKNNKNYPNFLEMVDNNRDHYNVPRSVYMGIFEGMSQFAVKNGREPNWVVVSGTANNPHAIDYQNNAYNCGPASTSMCFQMLAKWVPESTLARSMGTTRNGTSPSEIKSAVREYGFEFVEINRNISSVKTALSEGSPVLMHIHTSYSGGRSCLGYVGDYGHYIMCYGVEGNYYLLADPTKGYKKCLGGSIDNAKSSSNMKYYRLNIL